MMKAIRTHEFGNADVLKYEDSEKPEPEENEARLKLEAIGVNFIDVYHRTGLYPNKLPFIPGMEGAGIVDAVGAGVSDVKQGDRVAYAMNLGSYAEYSIVPAWKLVKIPDEIDTKTACAAMLQGMTAHYLTHSTFPLKKNNIILLHAAAGGVGLLLTQMAKILGAKVIGTVGNDEKAKLAKENGVDEAIIYTKEDFEEKVKELTNGKGVDVVYDSVGKATFEKSLNCLKPRGMLVSFGQSSGAIERFNPAVLSQKGSLFLTRPTLSNYCSDRAELLSRSNDLFNWIKNKEMKIKVHKAFRLSEAKKAHEELEGIREDFVDALRLANFHHPNRSLYSPFCVFCCSLLRVLPCYPGTYNAKSNWLVIFQRKLNQLGGNGIYNNHIMISLSLNNGSQNNYCIDFFVFQQLICSERYFKSSRNMKFFYYFCI